MTPRLLGLVAGLALLLAAPAPAAARARSPFRSCGHTGHPIYNLLVARSARCGTALVVASRLSRRFDSRRDFHGTRSRVRIVQRDALRRGWTCRWQDASAHHDIVLWACNRGTGVVTWIWRAHRL